MQANQIKGQYLKTVAELNTEITTLQEELDVSKKEARSSTVQLIELQKVLEDMKAQLMRQVSSNTYL